MPYIGKQLVRGQNRKLDDISSGFNGSQTTFTLQVASQNVTVGSALQLWISLGGVIQDPLSDYTIAGNQITFTTAPAASLDFFGVIQGDVTDTNTPGDATVTTSKLATGLTVNLADGSAATSSLQLGGTDSGLFSSAADKVNVTTGGVERLEIGDSEVVFNDPSNDVDFRVESNGNTHMLFVDAGNDAVGIGTSGPADYSSSADDLVIAGSGQRGITIASTDSTQSNIFFADATSGSGEFAGYLAYQHSSDDFLFGSGGVEAMRLDSSNRLMINTSTKGEGSADNLTIADSANCGITLRSGTTSQSNIFFSDGTSGAAQYDGYIAYNQNTRHMVFGTAETERMRIDSSGRFLVGLSASTALGTDSYLAQIKASGASAGLGIIRTADSVAPPFFSLAKSRNDGIVQSGDGLGKIQFIAHDGTDYNNVSALISAEVDGTPGNNDVPGRLMFHTTADGASSPTERMRIGSDGVVKISQSAANTLRVINTTSSGANMLFQNTTTGTSVGNGFFVGIGDNEASYIWSYHNEPIIWANNNAERMRLNTSGNFMVGQTNGSSGTVGIVCNANGLLTNCTSNVTAQVTNINNLSGTKILHLFRSDGTNRGSIETNGSSVSYNTTSDYRIKENVVDIDGAIDRVKQLLPKRFNFISHPERTVDGFLAHEAQTVVPEAVTGTYNEVDDDGNAVMQGIDQSKLVPLLTAALQEAIAKIETLETKVAALEAE